MNPNIIFIREQFKKTYIKKINSFWNKKAEYIKSLSITSIQHTPFYFFQYSIAGIKILDLSLIRGDGIFEFKPPLVLKAAMFGNKYEVIELNNKLIEKIQRTVKTGTLTDPELKHLIYLQHIVNWVLRGRGMGVQERKKLIAGDLKNAKYY